VYAADHFSYFWADVKLYHDLSDESFYKHINSVIIVLLPLGSSIPKSFSILSQEVTSWAFFFLLLLVLSVPRPEIIFNEKTKDFNIFAVVKYIFQHNLGYPDF